MFAYIDERISDLLCDERKIMHVDREGRALGCPASGQPFLSMIGPVPIPVWVRDHEVTFQWYPFVRRSDLANIEKAADEVRKDRLRDLFPLVSSYMAVNSLLSYGDFSTASHPLVRVHSSCLTSDVLGSRRCECGPQLHHAMELIVDEGCGAIVYMAGHEGRGIGLWAKAVTYLLQDMGQDTYQANEALGLPADSRSFEDAGVALKALRPQGNGIRLLTNNPMKQQQLESMGVTIASVEPLVCGLTDHNKRYLEAKRLHGHTIPEAFLQGPHR
ncbi:MAG: GTP cyclohydrolase II [Deltaproteobacteria bacterium]|nr:GTP cyclohydrolase II [Deltaproteobacteria bacterium]